MILKEDNSNLLKEDGYVFLDGSFVDYKFKEIKRTAIETSCTIKIYRGTGDTSNYARTALVTTVTDDTHSGSKTDEELITYYNNQLKAYGNAGYTIQQ